MWWRKIIGRKKRPTKAQQGMIDSVELMVDDPAREILYVEAFDAICNIYIDYKETLDRSKKRYLLETLRDEIDVMLRVMKATDDRKRT